jgi:large subunit ribosomal protein L10
VADGLVNIARPPGHQTPVYQATNMSKAIKQMQMDALKKTFGELRDLVLLSVSGLPSIAENQMRLALRKKKIRLHTVKNSLATRVFKDMGMPNLAEHFMGPTTVAWGSSSVADLSKELDALAKKNDKIKPRIAVADGAVVSFDVAKKFPTRAEALGRIAGLILAPGSRVAGMLKGPASTLAGQIKSISEKKGDEPPAAAAAGT